MSSENMRISHLNMKLLMLSLHEMSCFCCCFPSSPLHHMPWCWVYFCKAQLHSLRKDHWTPYACPTLSETPERSIFWINIQDLLGSH